MQKSFVLGLLFLIVLAGAASAKAVIPVYDCQVLDKPNGHCIAINAHFVKFDLGGHKIAGNDTGQGISSHDFYDIEIKNGEINNFAEGIHISNGQNNKISNISFNYNKYAAISLYQGESNIIEGNLVNNVKTNYLSSGVWSYRSIHILVKNNSFNENSNGIYVIEGENNQILDNNLKNSGQNSILIEDSTGTSIKHNLINNLGPAFPQGIQLLGETSESIIENNSIKGNGNIGILLENGPFNNKISYNDIEKQKKGLWIEEGANNTINHNSIMDNTFAGLILEEGENNLIYDNLFNNNVNVIFEDEIFANSWNTSLTTGPNIIGGPFIGGNVWLQPNGGGFSQTCLDINQDRICDESYNLEENNTDYLPLAWFELGAPIINFIAPTPAHGSSQNQDSIYVNVSSSAEKNHYVFLDFDKTNKLWMRMDDIDADGNPLDLSSYSNNGTLYGDAHKINDGEYGSSFAFDGSSDSIQIDYPVTTKTDNVSLAFWAKWAGDT